MILLDSVTENVTSESLLEIFVIGLLVVKGNLLNVLCHKNDEMVPFLVDKRLELQKVLQKALDKCTLSVLVNRAVVSEYGQSIEN
jgi:hypothetical protein